MSPVAWTPWRPLRLKSDVPAALLAEQLDGGQAFRWARQSDGVWVGVFGRTVARLRAGGPALEWSAPEGCADAEVALGHYLDAEGRQARIADDLPWRSDPVLQAAMAANPGLRILRQDPHDTLIGFLCSSNKRIPQIRTMVAALAREFGEPLAGGFHALPALPALAAADDATLRRCSLGYRGAYLRGTARMLEARPKWADEFARMDTPALLQVLQGLPGVGPKVAACVALFGFGRLESFPVDTWVVQALSSAYGLKGWSPARLEEFGRLHFGAGAGLAQQFLFSAARQGLLPAAEARVTPGPKPRPKPRA